MAVKAAPMMMPIARSSTLPLSANSLNSFSIASPSSSKAACSGARMLSRPPGSAQVRKRHAPRCKSRCVRALERSACRVALRGAGMARLLPPERDIGVLHAPVRSCLALTGIFLLVAARAWAARADRHRAGRRARPASSARPSRFSSSPRFCRTAAAPSTSMSPTEGLRRFRRARQRRNLCRPSRNRACRRRLSHRRGVCSLRRPASRSAISSSRLRSRRGLRSLGAYTPGDFVAARFGGFWARLVWAADRLFGVLSPASSRHLKIAAPLDRHASSASRRSTRSMQRPA